MQSLTCNHANHQDKSIQLLCLNAECKKNSALCLTCLMEEHSECTKQVKELKIIPEEIKKLRQLYDQMADLQQRINYQFKMDLSEIESILNPIISYQENLTLTKLNQIGVMLKGVGKEKITAVTNKCIDTIRSFLDNCVEKSEINSKDAYYWHEQGEELREKRQFNEALDFFEKAIELRPDVLRFQYSKCISWYTSVGWTLYSLKRLDEAIICLDKAIKIQPNKKWSFYYKGELLMKLNKYQDAMRSYDEAIKLGIDGDYLSQINQIGGAIECYKRNLSGSVPQLRFHAMSQLKLAQNLEEQLMKF